MAILRRERRYKLSLMGRQGVEVEIPSGAPKAPGLKAFVLLVLL